MHNDCFGEVNLNNRVVSCAFERSSERTKRAHVFGGSYCFDTSSYRYNTRSELGWSPLFTALSNSNAIKTPLGLTQPPLDVPVIIQRSISRRINQAHDIKVTEVPKDDAHDRQSFLASLVTMATRVPDPRKRRMVGQQDSRKVWTLSCILRLMSPRPPKFFSPFALPSSQPTLGYRHCFTKIPYGLPTCCLPFPCQTLTQIQRIPAQVMCDMLIQYFST
ncbi:hypothetical protein F4861DRAFT_275463 [Xylaria intraflava]|nr:hypothetical protein F4861DRAFT_275463 [Xylaria intraflava]